MPAAAAAEEEQEFLKLLDAYREQTGKRAGKAQKEKLRDYMTVMSAEVVQEAFLIAEDAGSDRWGYTKRILDDWMEANVKTIADARAERGKGFGKKPSGGLPATPERAESLRQDLEWMDRFLAEHGGEAE